MPPWPPPSARETTAAPAPSPKMIDVMGSWKFSALLAVSEPITDVYVYANLKNTRRHFVQDGEPRALGVFPLGDALLHANPIAGRGCTIGWVSAYLLADAWNEAEGDLLAFARALDERISRDIVPAWRALRPCGEESLRKRSGPSPAR